MSLNLVERGWSGMNRSIFDDKEKRAGSTGAFSIPMIFGQCFDALLNESDARSTPSRALSAALPAVSLTAPLTLSAWPSARRRSFPNTLPAVSFTPPLALSAAPSILFLSIVFSSSRVSALETARSERGSCPLRWTQKSREWRAVLSGLTRILIDTKSDRRQLRGLPNNNGSRPGMFRARFLREPGPSSSQPQTCVPFPGVPRRKNCPERLARCSVLPPARDGARVPSGLSPRH